MNRDDIIRLAKEAGLTQKPFCRWGGYLDDLVRFADLVAADVLRDCGWGRVDDIDALRRDAERYRWMKQEVKRIPPSWGLIGWDAAIDAAMEDKP